LDLGGPAEGQSLKLELAEYLTVLVVATLLRVGLNQAYQSDTGGLLRLELSIEVGN
jgi:hypothetical protein